MDGRFALPLAEGSTTVYFKLQRRRMAWLGRSRTGTGISVTWWQGVGGNNRQTVLCCKRGVSFDSNLHAESSIL